MLLGSNLCINEAWFKTGNCCINLYPVQLFMTCVLHINITYYVNMLLCFYIAWKKTIKCIICTIIHLWNVQINVLSIYICGKGINFKYQAKICLILALPLLYKHVLPLSLLCKHVLPLSLLCKHVLLLSLLCKHELQVVFVM